MAIVSGNITKIFNQNHWHACRLFLFSGYETKESGNRVRLERWE